MKAILMTGYDHAQVLNETELNGFNAALSKPFTVDTLRKVLAEVLG